MVDLIINKAAVELFNTPVPSVIPTDSFAEDYDLDYKKNDLNLPDMETL